jgi:hypothetical protein
MLSIRSYHFTPKLVQTVLGPKKAKRRQPIGLTAFYLVAGALNHRERTQFAFAV